MTLWSTKIVTGGKTNITCYECATKGHYSNECPMKLNVAPEPTAHAQDPVITKASTNPYGSKDPTNIPSSSGATLSILLMPMHETQS
jgi:hypothetical protein